MKKLVIFGASNFAQICEYYFTNDSDYSVAAFTIDGAYIREPTFCDRPVVPFEEVEREFPPDEYDMFVAAGIRKVNRFRAQKVDEAEAKGYRLASHLSPRATAPRGFTLQPNTIVMELSHIMLGGQIGRNTIVWPWSQLPYLGRVGSHCWIVSMASGEQSSIGDFTFVGIRATIAPGVQVGASNIIGAGALVMHDTADGAVIKGHEGTTARVTSDRAARLIE
ncbi:MAG: hypothetical protein AB7Q29_05550 [Vicinamibacterales bacterium]